MEENARWVGMNYFSFPHMECQSGLELSISLPLGGLSFEKKNSGLGSGKIIFLEGNPC